MSKGGYDKLLKKYEETAADNLRLQGQIAERNSALAEMRNAADLRGSDSKPDTATGQTKLRELWNSTSLWAVVGILVTLVISPISLKLAYSLAWGVVSVEAIRLRPFGGKRKETIFNFFFPVVLATAIIGSWPYIPKPKDQPNFDVALAKFGDSLADKIAAKTKPGAPSTIVISQPTPEHHTHVAYASVEHLSEILTQKYHFPPLSLAPGDTPQIPMGFFDSGDYEVLNSQDAAVFIPVPTKEVNDAFGAARKTFKFSPIGGGVPPHQPETFQYHTLYGPEINEGMRDQIYSGDTQLCAFGAVKWRDVTGEYETDGAECLLVERFGTKLTYNWHGMQQNNRETKLR